MHHRQTKIAVARPLVMTLTFSDGFGGDLDLGSFIRTGRHFEPLADPAFFGEVAIAPDGRSFGWSLDMLGREIDFGADAARADIETALVEARAGCVRRRVQAAE